MVIGGKHFGQYTYEHWFDDEYGNKNTIDVLLRLEEEKTYSDSNYENFWNSISNAFDLFHISAEKVANYLNISYNQNEENGMNKYLEMVKNDYNVNNK